VGTIQFDLSREIAVHADANEHDIDKTFFVCASTTDVSIHVSDTTGASLRTSAGMPRVVDIPQSFFDSQIASKLHREEVAGPDGETRVEWTLRTLGSKVLKPAGARYLRLNLLDTGEWTMRRRQSQEDLAAMKGDSNDEEDDGDAK
jgi:hypothetical protein